MNTTTIYKEPLQVAIIGAGLVSPLHNSMHTEDNNTSILPFKFLVQYV